MAKVEKKDKAKKAQVNKTPELAAAKKNLENYFKENKLDPTKDYSKDKKHGKKVTELLSKLNKERDKAAAKYPESDPKQMKRLGKMANGKVKQLEGQVKKDKAVATRTSSKYDYPLVDGREMTSAEKKKYRAEQRRLASGSTSKPSKAADKATDKKPAKSKSKSKEETVAVGKKKTITNKTKVKVED